MPPSMPRDPSDAALLAAVLARTDAFASGSTAPFPSEPLYLVEHDTALSPRWEGRWPDNHGTVSGFHPICDLSESTFPRYGQARRRSGGVVYRTGLENRRRGNSTVGSNPTSSATCPRESILPIRLRPDFSVVFKGYARSPFHRSRHAVTPKRSLRASILRGSALRTIWCRAVRTCYPCVFASVQTSHSAKPSAHDATLASEKAAFELVSRWTWFIDQPVLARPHLRAW